MLHVPGMCHLFLVTVAAAAAAEEANNVAAAAAPVAAAAVVAASAAAAGTRALRASTPTQWRMSATSSALCAALGWSSTHQPAAHCSRCEWVWGCDEGAVIL